MGSVFHDLQVPDYNASGLTMSGLLVTTATARGQFTPQPDVELPAGALPAPATSRRTFSQNDVVSVFAEIYDNISSRDPREVAIATTLVGADGVAAFSSRESVSSRGASGDMTPPRIAHTKQIPLKDMRPGNYVLKVEVRASATGAKPVARETPVTVTP